MTVRARAWIGALAVAVGAGLMVVALLSAKVVSGRPSYSPAMLWGGIALAAVGIGMILWSFAGALRQIGSSGAQFEARLRAEADAQREQKKA